MELIAPYELNKQCREIGHEIIHEVLTNGPNVSDETFDEIFEPLITSIEDRTRFHVEKEIDELRGQLEDQDREEELDDIVSKRRAEISERFYVSNLDILVYSWFLPRRNTDKIEYTVVHPQLDIDDVSDAEVLRYGPDNHHWNQYRRVYAITFIDQYLSGIYKCITSYGNLFTFIKDNDLSLDQITNYLRMLDATGIIIGSEASVFLKVANFTHNYNCQLVIRKGIRKGMICGRTLYRQGKCRYHIRQTAN